MGFVSKYLMVALRLWELICSVIILGILGRFLHLLNIAGAEHDGRVIYAISFAVISTLYSILFMPPFMHAFLAFPADFVLFVAWLVAFCLLIVRSGTDTCGSYWYWSYWGYYWGSWWYYPFPVLGPGDINYDGCGQWRAVLAFSFIVSFTYLVSAILGGIVVFKYYNEGKVNKDKQTKRTAPLQP
ncbi:hypothetical protein B0T24DRAFT_592990 [Lasiosphaeria ovina]|uniref:MARVEL domain-containing protein n=1 Tax=Lasiosphaeria ovina TaxID=92902 RepID=A0AAE0NB25_9PEZI|nr:hypothetical protein B0T24DRAFT_592990 [Lasiosphaeria ovina]